MTLSVNRYRYPLIVIRYAVHSLLTTYHLLLTTYHLTNYRLLITDYHLNMTPKPVTLSQTTITELMIPSYANFGGKIHGGILLSLMDKVAYACASKHASTYCVTVSVDNVEFLQPVEVGELVSLHASVNYVGRTSLIIGIRVEAQNVKLGTIKHTNSSYFTMVAKGDDDKPTKYPS